MHLETLMHFTHRMWNKQWVWDDWEIQIMHVAICLIIFRGYMNTLFNIKGKILLLIMWPYKSLQSFLLLSIQWLTYLEHILQSSWRKHVLLLSFLRFAPNHIPLEYRCLDNCYAKFRYFYLKCMRWLWNPPPKKK